MLQIPATARRTVPLLASIALATALAVWLRTYGLTGQVVLDDEWHAIHKLTSSSYLDILTTFGLADHSIPLTLLYKAMAETVGLAEGRLRSLQAICGVAFVPSAAWLAWRATRDAPAAALFAFTVSAAPFLVMWSRFARPYAIWILLALLCVACVWGWRSRRTVALAAWAGVAAALAAWFFPLAGIYPAIACLFVFAEDVLAGHPVRPRPWRGSLGLGAAVAGAMALILAAPLVHDRASLAGKSGGDWPDLGTLERMVAVFWGGLPTPAMWIACGLAAFGVVVLWRRDSRLTLLLVLLLVVPGLVLMVTGALWLHAGQNFARYTLLGLPIMLLFGSLGAVATARLAAERHASSAAWAAAAVLAVAYLAATPAIAQVARLGPWYGHIDHHWDYRYRWIHYKRKHPDLDPPAFYRRLARMAPGSAPLVEAPFLWEAPYNPLAYYALWHHQPITLGMLHDVCLEGRRIGEPPPDARFRFRKFVFLGDVEAVKRTGARYLVLHRDRMTRLVLHPDRIERHPFEQERCLARLVALYGAPVESDAQVAVFDLRPPDPPPAAE